MNPEDYSIIDLIPQRPPMVMIDALVFAVENTAKGQLLIRESNLFCRNGILQEPGLIEFIAQTAAAYTGYKNKSGNGNVAEGYIGAIKNLVIYNLPSADTLIQSEIIIENEIIGYTIITGRVKQDEKLLASCEMRIIEHGVK
jgi:predicted hotdog family 3-hydroxylacyl-ACP dehydratase